MPTIYLKAGGYLREKLKPDVDEFTRCLQLEGSPTLGEILDSLGIARGLVAFAMLQDRMVRLDHRPQNGELLTLHPPVSGG